MPTSIRSLQEYPASSEQVYGAAVAILSAAGFSVAAADATLKRISTFAGFSGIGCDLVATVNELREGRSALEVIETPRPGLGTSRTGEILVRAVAIRLNGAEPIEAWRSAAKVVHSADSSGWIAMLALAVLALVLFYSSQS
jgi:hypothetical protein